MADPCSEEQMTSNNEKINDIGINNWLELQEQAKNASQPDEGACIQPHGRPTKVCPIGDQRRQWGPP